MEQARPKAALKRMRLPEQFAWMPFVLPGVTVAVLLTVYPTYSVVSASLFGDTAKGNGFVGLDNFAALFRQPRMELYLWNTFLWVVITSTGALVLGVVGAFALEVRGIGLRGLCGLCSSCHGSCHMSRQRSSGNGSTAANSGC